MSTIAIGSILQNMTGEDVCCVQPGEAVEVTEISNSRGVDIKFIGDERTCYLFDYEAARLDEMVEEPDEPAVPALPPVADLPLSYALEVVAFVMRILTP